MAAGKRFTALCSSCAIQGTAEIKAMGSPLQQTGMVSHSKDACFCLLSSCNRQASLLVQDSPSALLQIVVDQVLQDLNDWGVALLIAPLQATETHASTAEGR